MFKNNSLDVNKNTKQVFAYIYIMNKLIDDINVKENFMNRLETLISKYPFVNLKHYGFPETWREILK